MRSYRVIPHTADIRLKVEGDTLREFFVASLLIDFLSEVLTYSQVDHAIFCKIVFEKLGKKSLMASIFGAPVETFDEDIKAVTYHEAEIKKNKKGNYETMVVFDV